MTRTNTPIVDAVLFDFLGKQRHESCVECAFSEQAPEQVWKPECGIKSVGHRSGTQCRRHHRLAAETEEAAGKRRAADSHEFFDKAH